MLLTESDYISLHAPLTPQTRHLINAATLAKMKATAVIVNTARGELIDEKALATALSGGRIAAAGLDVFEQEPPAPDHPLLRSPNVVLSGHVGWYSKDAVRELQTRAAQEIVRVLSGGRPAWKNAADTFLSFRNSVMSSVRRRVAQYTIAPPGCPAGRSACRIW